MAQKASSVIITNSLVLKNVSTADTQCAQVLNNPIKNNDIR